MSIQWMPLHLIPCLSPDVEGCLQPEAALHLGPDERFPDRANAEVDRVPELRPEGRRRRSEQRRVPAPLDSKISGGGQRGSRGGRPQHEGQFRSSGRRGAFHGRLVHRRAAAGASVSATSSLLCLFLGV